MECVSMGRCKGWVQQAVLMPQPPPLLPSVHLRACPWTNQVFSETFTQNGKFVFGTTVWIKSSDLRVKFELMDI